MSDRGLRWSALLLSLLGVVGVGILHWMVFFWVPTESTMGVVQRIFYIHVPAAWVAFMALDVVAL
jgi:heme exporter protein C